MAFASARRLFNAAAGRRVLEWLPTSDDRGALSLKELKDKDKELPEGGFEGLPHFIPKTLRPDLTAVAIAREPTLPTQEEIEAAKAERDQHDQRRPKKPKGK